MVTVDEAKQAAIDCFEGINERDLTRAVQPFTDDAVFEFIGAGPDEKLRGRDAIAANFTGWWKAFPRIQNDILGMTVDDAEPSERKTVAVEWDQASTDLEGVVWRRRGVTIFVVTDGGAVECRDYLSEVFDPRPAGS